MPLTMISVTGPDREPLTHRQRQIYDYIAARISTGYPPTLREIGHQFGISSTNGVTDHLQSLSRKGWIKLGEGGKSRGIRLVGADVCPAYGARKKGAVA